MRKTYRFTLGIVGAVFLMSAGLYRSAQPPYNTTGADGSTCGNCHGNLNTGGGGVAAPGLPVGGYVPGQGYDFGIMISHPTTRGRWGFSITARDANNAVVGSFSDSNPNAGPNVDELSHLNAVFSTGTSFTYDNLRWTAPANPTVAQQSVKFYFIGNAANGDGGTTGDFIYSGTAISAMVPPVNQPPVVSITSPANNAIFPAGALATLTANATDADGAVKKVEFYDHGVKFYTDSIAPYTLVSSNEIEPGEYVLTAKAFDNSGDSSISAAIHVTVTACTSTGFATGEGYLNIPGVQVSDMLNHPSYPSSPGITAQLSSLEYSNVGNNYGGRASGYICAPFTGNYTFYIAGDDQAGLLLSTDDNPANKVLIAYTLTPTGFREWTKYSSQRSAPIKLVKGGRYYFETLHKQGAGSNHLSVRWVMPNGAIETPIGANRLSPFQPAGAPPVKGNLERDMKSLNQVNVEGFIVKATPNPSSSQFLINIKSDNNSPLRARIVDVMGRTVIEKTGMDASSQWQVGNELKPGTYILEVTQGIRREKIMLVKR